MEKLTKEQMRLIIGGVEEGGGGGSQMVCANCFLPNETVCVWHNPNTSHCSDSGYHTVFCVKISTGEQTVHECSN